MAYTQNGQYEIDYITINVGGEQIDLKGVMLELVLYESILSSTMTGTITIVETANLINNNSIGYGDVIKFNYSTAGFQKRKFEGVVYKISAPSRITEKSTGYTLYFTTKELINNLSEVVTEGYRSEISDMAQFIFDKVDTKIKPLVKERTRNIEQFVFPTVQPFEAISMLTRKAVSDSGNYGYMFYEDSVQFNFRSIESLYQQEPIAHYTYKSGKVYEDSKQSTKESFSSFQEYTILPNISYIEYMGSGLLGSTWNFFSVHNKQTDTYKYNIEESFKKDKSLGSFPLAKNSLEIDYDNTNFLGYRGVPRQNGHPYVMNKNSWANIETQQAIVVTFGNSDVRVGVVCTAIIPLWSSNNTNPTNPDKDLLSGKFLFSEIKHVFSIESYIQTIKLTKNAFEDTNA